MTRPRNARVSVTSTPGRSGPLRCGRTASRLICQRGRLAGSREEGEHLVGRAERSLPCARRWSSSGGASPCARPGIVTVPAVAPVDVMLLGPPRVVRDGAAGRVRHAQGARAARGARAGRPAAARATCSPSCCGPSTTRSTRAARCGGRCRRCARRVGADFVDATRDQRQPRPRPGALRRRRPLPRARRGRRRGGRRGAVPRRVPGGLRAPRRARVRGLAARRGRRAAARARDGAGAAGGGDRATWRSRSAGSSSTRCTSPRTGR